jgi:hypothetical protein
MRSPHIREQQMSMPPLEERATWVLAEETKRLRRLYAEIAKLAREKEMEPAFAEVLIELNDSIGAIEAELAGRDGA